MKIVTRMQDRRLMLIKYRESSTGLRREMWVHRIAELEAIALDLFNIDRATTRGENDA